MDYERTLFSRNTVRMVRTSSGVLPEALEDSDTNTAAAAAAYCVNVWRTEQTDLMTDQFLLRDIKAADVQILLEAWSPLLLLKTLTVWKHTGPVTMFTATVLVFSLDRFLSELFWLLWPTFQRKSVILYFIVSSLKLMFRLKPTTR